MSIPPSPSLLVLCAFAFHLWPRRGAVLAAETTTTAASKYKAPNSSTPPDVAERWWREDESLWSYVSSHVPAVLDHTGSSAFDEHLRGVQAVLRHWNAPTHLTNAGLFHSIYGTEGFQGFALPLSERDAVRDLIGERAERLCWIFCMVDRFTVDETVFEWDESTDVGNDDGRTRTFKARPELGRFDVELAKEEWLDFVELTLADWMEQVEGAATKTNERFFWKEGGGAYAYRRDAYARMAHLLSKERPARLGQVAIDMHRDVMATEPLGTRNLVQVRTPPMSDAAVAALEALRSAGEEVLEDFSPRSRDGEVCNGTDEQ